MITITAMDGSFTPLTYDIDLSMTVIANVFVNITIRSTRKSQAAYQYTFHNAPLNDASTLASCGINTNDLIVAFPKQSPQASGRHQAAGMISPPPSSRLAPHPSAQRPMQPQPQHRQQQQLSIDEIVNNPQRLIDYYRLNPQQLQAPQLHDAVKSNDLNAVKTIMVDIRNRQQMQVEMERRAMNNPYDVEAQKFIEDQIAQQNIAKSFLEAMDQNPEVVMLYIPVSINNVPVKAFVDSGAQMTIMSKECAEKCNLLRLIDTRFQGIAKGVGVGRIIGRVHSANLRVGSVEFPCSFSIMENQPMDLLFGLDNLRKHRCVIDMENDRLVIGTAPTRESIRFLPEHEIPKDPEHSTTSSTSAPTEQNLMDDNAVTQIMELTRRDRQSVVNALRQAHGNPDVAVTLLIGTGGM